MAKQVTAQYRYVNTEDLWDGFNLQAMVADILRRRAPHGTSDAKIFEDVSTRKIDLDQDGSFVVLNKLSDPATWNGHYLCGQLIHVKAGMDVPGITGSLDDAVPELELQNLHLGDQARIVEGVLYFAVHKNHLCLIEGQRTKARTLERYLTRLLQDAGELEPGKTVLLNAKLEGGVREVQEISIVPQPVEGPPEEGDQVVEETEERARAHGEGATVIDILRLLGWSPEDIHSLEESLPPGGRMEGIFRVLFRRKNRRVTISRETLETALRHIDPASLGMLGDGGAREKGGLVKLSKRVKVNTVGELLDPEDAMQKIMDTLRLWARQGKIDCDFG